MKFPYGQTVRQDEIGREQVTLTVRFGPKQREEFAQFRADMLNGTVVKWPHLRRWLPASGSYDYHDSGYVTAIVCMHRVK